MGRPSKAQQWLSDDGLALLEHWKRNDLTDAEIAKRIGIKAPTLIDWKKRFPQISEALKKGSEYSVADAERALISKFKVTTIKEKKTETWENADGTKRKHVVTTEKQVMPDTTAIIFFLKAKAGWRDDQEITDTTAIDKLDELLNATYNEAMNRKKDDDDDNEK